MSATRRLGNQPRRRSAGSLIEHCLYCQTRYVDAVVIYTIVLYYTRPLSIFPIFFFNIGDDLMFTMSSRSYAMMGIVLTEITFSSRRSKFLPLCLSETVAHRIIISQF